MGIARSAHKATCSTLLVSSAQAKSKWLLLIINSKVLVPTDIISAKKRTELSFTSEHGCEFATCTVITNSNCNAIAW